MNRFVDRRFFAPLFRAFSAIALAASVVVPAAAVPNGPMRLTPEQRAEMWQRMTPQQRQQFREFRQMTPEQRQELRGQFTPDERRAMRERFLERQQQNNRGPGAEPNLPPRRQLSPEERQQLRDQINQARRDFYRRNEGGNKGPNK